MRCCVCLMEVTSSGSTSDLNRSATSSAAAEGAGSGSGFSMASPPQPSLLLPPQLWLPLRSGVRVEALRPASDWAKTDRKIFRVGIGETKRQLDPAWCRFPWAKMDFCFWMGLWVQPIWQPVAGLVKWPIVNIDRPMEINRLLLFSFFMNYSS